MVTSVARKGDRSCIGSGLSVLAIFIPNIEAENSASGDRP
jgi:hypothetical protein